MNVNKASRTWNCTSTMQDCHYKHDFSFLNLVHLLRKILDSSVTYILLQCSAPNCHYNGYKTFGIDAHISDCTDSNTKDNQCNAKLCVPWIPHVVQDNFQKTRYWNHTQLCNLTISSKTEKHCKLNSEKWNPSRGESKYLLFTTSYLIESNRVPH